MGLKTIKLRLRNVTTKIIVRYNNSSNNGVTKHRTYQVTKELIVFIKQNKGKQLVKEQGRKEDKTDLKSIKLKKREEMDE